MKKGGVLVSIAGESIDQPSPGLGVTGIFFIVKPDRQQLMEIARLIDGGFVRTIIAGVFPLTEAEQAFEMLTERGKVGKIVLRVD